MFGFRVVLFFLLFVYLCGQATAEICDGRYVKAAALIDKTYSKYGTLYSGGRSYEGIGGTLDIYRMLSGLPDAGFSVARDWRSELEYLDKSIELASASDEPETKQRHIKQVGEAVGRSLERLRSAEFKRDTEKTTSDPEVILDIYTTLGPYLGWWLDSNNRQLSAVEGAIAAYGHDDGMDWLHTVLAASANGVRMNWGTHNYNYTIAGRGYLSLFKHSLRQFAAKDSLPWFVAAHLMLDRYSGGRYDVLRGKDAGTDKLFDRYRSLSGSVKACTATDGEYVAHAIALHERIRVGMGAGADYEKTTGHPPNKLDDELKFMPNVLRDMVAVSMAKLMTYLTTWEKQKSVSDAQLLSFSTRPAYASWLNVFRSYRASSVDELIELNKGVALDPKTIRLLNLLSVDDLVRFYKSRVNLPSEQRMIYTTAFLRMFALGRDEEAKMMVQELARLWPKVENEILTIWKGKESIGYRLAKIVKLLPKQSTIVLPDGDWRSREHRARGMVRDNLQSDSALIEWFGFRRSWDMPLNIRTGAFLVRDVEKWMKTSGASPFAGFRFSLRAFNRGAENFMRLSESSAHRYRKEEYSLKMKNGIMSYAAYGELQELSPENGLANRVARELILHARQRSNPVLKHLWREDESVAEELRYVVHLGRRMISGRMDGKPVSQVAFELLHQQFGETKVAQKTKYWYICKDRCEP